MEEYLREYRGQLVTGRQNVLEAYEKTLLSLATGSLALSVVFVKDIFGGTPTDCAKFWLFTAWGGWLVTIFALVISLYISPFAFSKAIKQVDAGTIEKGIAGGFITISIYILHALSGLSFVLGLLSIVIVGVKKFGG